MRLYFDPNKLPDGWIISHEQGFGHCLRKVTGLRFLLASDGLGLFLDTDEESAPKVQKELRSAISKVTIICAVNDPEHKEILDKGEHYVTSAQAMVMRVITGRGSDKFDIFVEGENVEATLALYHKILRGRQADEPYYKITSFKRWLMIRFRRFCRGWASMNAEMRGETA